MPKKKVVRKKKANEFKGIEKEIKKEIGKAEKWVVERRKFFIKLAKVIIFVLLLLMISNIYLRVRGIGS